MAVLGARWDIDPGARRRRRPITSAACLPPAPLPALHPGTCRWRATWCAWRGSASSSASTPTASATTRCSGTSYGAPLAGARWPGGTACAVGPRRSPCFAAGCRQPCPPPSPAALLRSAPLRSTSPPPRRGSPASPRRLIDAEVIPVLKQSSLAGAAEFRTQTPLLSRHPHAVDIMIDVLSDRGFRWGLLCVCVCGGLCGGGGGGGLGLGLPGAAAAWLGVPLGPLLRAAASRPILTHSRTHTPPARCSATAWATRWRSGWCPSLWTWPPGTSACAQTTCTCSGKGRSPGRGWWRHRGSRACSTPLAHLLPSLLPSPPPASLPPSLLPPSRLPPIWPPPLPSHPTPTTSPAGSRLTRRMCATCPPPPP